MLHIAVNEAALIERVLKRARGASNGASNREATMTPKCSGSAWRATAPRRSR